MGGVNGSLPSAVVARYRKMKGILLGSGFLIGRIMRDLAVSGVANPCSVVEGKFFESIPSGIDAYLPRHEEQEAAQVPYFCVPCHTRLFLRP